MIPILSWSDQERWEVVAIIYNMMTSHWAAKDNNLTGLLMSFVHGHTATPTSNRCRRYVLGIITFCLKSARDLGMYE